MIGLETADWMRVSADAQRVPRKAEWNIGKKPYGRGPIERMVRLGYILFFFSWAQTRAVFQKVVQTAQFIKAIFL